jgi:hypothetical protein
MAVRRDEVQLDIQFITDESRALARTIGQTKELNDSIDKSRAKIQEYNRELKKVGEDETKRVAILAKIANEEKNIASNLAKVAEEGRKVANLNLNNVAPAQLVERSKQLAQAIKLIPQSAPEFARLQQELGAVNTRLREINQAAKGIKDIAPEGGAGGGILQQVLGVAGGIGLVDSIQAAASAVINYGRTALKEFDAGLKADAQLKTAIQSTGGAAGRSLEELKTQAEDLAKVTLFGDDTTKGAQALLLTFKNVKTEVFDQAIPLAQDLSTAFGQDLNASAIQLGKALDNPIQGVTALRRVGVSFSEDQQKMIKSLVETGRTADAQKLILKELESQVGGSARAAAEAGLGPFQQLQNRLGEIQESVGGLIANGFQKLAPFLKGAVTFFEQLTERITTGKSATGEYATGVNVVAGVLQLVARVIQVVMLGLEGAYNLWLKQVEVISSFIDRVRGIPVVGELFEQFIITPLRFVFDAISNLPAAWAGFQAATRQALNNVVGDFKDMYLSAQVFVKNIQSTLTFSKDAKAKLAKEISDIEAERAAAAKAGKSIGQAYAEARDAVLTQTEGAAGGSTTNTTTGGGGTPPDIDLEEARKRLEERLANELKAVEVSIQRKELILENDRIRGRVNEQQFNEQMAAITEEGLRRRLEIYRVFKRDQSNEALKLQNDLALIEQGKAVGKVNVDSIGAAATPGAVNSQAQGGPGQALALQDQAENAREQALAQRFQRLLITEQDYELQRLELKKQALAEEIEILKNAGPAYGEAVTRKESEALRIQQEIEAKKLENTQRTEQLREDVQRAGIEASGQLFAFAADLLSQDERARKKNAIAVKAFQSAEVITSGILEAQTAYLQAVKSFGLPTGSVIGGVLAGIAIGRSALAAAKIQNTKFERGTMVDFAQRGMAKFGLFGGRPHSQGGTKGWFSDGTQVEVEKDEAWAVINKKNTPILMALSAINAHGGNGVPFFARGGIRKFEGGGLNTTPPAAEGPVQDLSRFMQAVDRFESIVAAFPTEVKSRVVYTEIEEAGSTLNAVRGDAGL